MSYSTLMVNLALRRPNTVVLGVARAMAARFQAGVVGVAVGQPMQLAYGDGYVYPDLIDQDRHQLDTDIATAAAEFHAAFAGHAGYLEWRASVVLTSLSGYIVDQARCADLLITGVTSSSLLEDPPQLSTGELVMQAGRPVLIVPGGAAPPALSHVLVGWKDTRETRRAAVDALPMLRKAARVTVVEIAAEAALDDTRGRLDDVAAWLGRHGIEAETLAAPSTGDDPGMLQVIASDLGADLVVAGAYGHSRVREWVLGGVTRDLLLHSGRCALLSH